MKKIKGKIWKFGDNINTDLIVSSKFLTTNKPEELVKHAFMGVKKDFSKNVNNGDIIIAGKNFGNGSSREEAVYVIKELGISAVIAESISRIYFRNLINNGIPAISIPKINQIFDEGDIIEINLESGIIICLNKKLNVKFKPIPNFIMEIIRCGGALNLIKKKNTLTF